jgi:hypothetical protein
MECRRWAEGALKSRGIQSIRTIQGLLCMAKKHSSKELDEACRKALSLEKFHLRDVRRQMMEKGDQPQFEFIQEHPLIRNLDFYGDIASFHEYETIKENTNEQ